MSEQDPAALFGELMDPPRRDLPPSEQRVVQALVDEHVHVSCQLVPIDERTWAIRGSIAVDADLLAFLES